MIKYCWTTWEVIGLQGQCDLSGIILVYSVNISSFYLKEQRTTEDTNTLSWSYPENSWETLAWISNDLKGFCPMQKHGTGELLSIYTATLHFAHFNSKGWINTSYLIGSAKFLFFGKVFLFLYSNRQKKREMIWRESSWIIKEFFSICCQPTLHSIFLCLIQEIWTFITSHIHKWEWCLLPSQISMISTSNWMAITWEWNVYAC